MSTKSRIISIAAVVLALGLMLIAFFQLPHEVTLAPPSLPEDSEVESITATLYNSPADEPDIPEYTIPSEYVPVVLKMFRPVEKHKHPAKVLDIGTLLVLTKSGESSELRFFFWGAGEPVLFSFQGAQCVRGGRFNNTGRGEMAPKYLTESLTINGVLQELNWQTIKGVKSNRLEELISLLERSAGR
jgi:hypothetical protein